MRFAKEYSLNSLLSDPRQPSINFNVSTYIKEKALKKIAICIFHPWNISSWFDTTIVQELSTRFDVTILATKDVLDVCFQRGLHKEISFRFEEVILSKPSLISRTYFFTSMIIQRKTNSSFAARLKKLIFGEVRLIPSPFELRVFLICLNSNLTFFITYIRKYFYQIPFFIPVIDRLFVLFWRYLFKKKKHAISDCFKNNFDLVVFSSAAEELHIFELIKELRNRNIKTLLCIENWDNLTSKRYMISQPDYTFVLGKNSKFLAAQYQDLHPDTVIAAGLPRFNPLRFLPKQYHQANSERFQILYAGFYLPHNEIKLLNELINKLDKTKISGNYDLVYKPHPGPRIRILDDSKLNEKIKVVTSAERKNPVLDQRHLMRILNADILIATPTSMIIECMVLGKKVVLDLTNDGINRTTAQAAYSAYQHLHILDKIEKLTKCYDLDQIVSQILEEFSNPTSKFIEYGLAELIENSETSYSTHISKLLK